MTSSNHCPRFFVSPESHLIGFRIIVPILLLFKFIFVVFFHLYHYPGGAEPNFELGPAVHQASALTPELGYAAPYLSYAAPCLIYAAPYLIYAAPYLSYPTPYLSYPAPYLSYAAPYMSFAAPYQIYAAPYLKSATAFFPAQEFRRLTPEDDLPGRSQFRLVLSWNWPSPGKSSSGVTKSRKMTYQGLAKSGL
jgi:hypothetical protein